MEEITTYQELIALMPDCPEHLLGLAGLHHRQRDGVAAAACYARAARLYTGRGFHRYAIALFERALETLGHDGDVHADLAALYLLVGRKADAQRHYLRAAVLHQGCGESGLAAQALAKVVDIDPDDVPTRVELAELSLRGGQRHEAVRHLRWAAGVLLASGRAVEYVRVARRIIHLDPDQDAVSRELAGVHASRGEMRAALEVVRVRLQHAPEEVPTLALLQQLFVSLRAMSKAALVAAEIARIERRRFAEGSGPTLMINGMTALVESALADLVREQR